MTNQEVIIIIGNLEDKDMLYNPCDVQEAKTKAISALTALEKIRAEIHATAEMHEDGGWYLREEWILQIIDKYTKGEQ